MAYYSRLETEVYHICKNCHVGNNIEAENLVEGQPAGSRLCKECADLRDSSNCTYGTPTPSK